MINTALHLAAFQGKRDVVTNLLDNGADIQAEGTNGCSALHVAATAEQTGVILVLLARGAKTEAKDVWGLTPLHHVAGDGKLRVVQMLAVRGEADVNATDNEGNTPLHSAVIGDNLGVEGIVDVIKILLFRGADKMVKESSGYVPAELSRGPNREAILKLLE